MNIKANGRAAIIMTAALLAMSALPARACETSDCQRIVLAQATDAQDAAAATEAPQQVAPAPRKKTRHSRHASRKADKLAKSAAAKKEADAKASNAETPADTTGPADGKHADATDTIKSGVTPAIANANAQMTGAAAPVDAQAAPLADTRTGSPATIDTLNTIDKAATTVPVGGASADSQVVSSDELNDLDRAAGDKPAPKVLHPVASTGSDDTWSQTSLIGKVFIAVGGLLTLASAARMFIA